MKSILSIIRIRISHKVFYLWLLFGFSIAAFSQEQSITDSNFGLVENVNLEGASAIPFEANLSSGKLQSPPVVSKTKSGEPYPTDALAQVAAPVAPAPVPVAPPLNPLAPQVAPAAPLPVPAPQATLPVSGAGQYAAPVSGAGQYAPPVSGAGQYTPPVSGAGQYAPQAPLQRPYPVAAPVLPSIPVRPPAIGSAASPLGFKSYRLSYMQSDRVLGLLKALGFATIEYSKGYGETVDSSLFSVIRGVSSYPLVVKIVDAAKTSLMQPALDGGRSAVGANSLGGTYLHQQTTGAPEQRLLIVYEKEYPDQLNSLVGLLRNEIDVPASQIVIEALVVEINTDKAKELGMQYTQVDKKSTATLGATGQLSGTFNSNENSLFSWNGPGAAYPTITGTYVDSAGTTQYSYPGMIRANPLGLSATLKAYVSDGHAEVLSNPSILVLDGRQARIQVGRQVPNISTLLQGTQSFASVSYIPTGIVLNIRPRITEDNSEVTMQIETIVSNAVFSTTDPTAPPQIENKQVQTFVRVADNTPFIVGGLISKNKDKGSTGIPVLSEIPILGNLFKKSLESQADREVIIVMTPHIINTNEKSFSYVIPKDSQSFDSFDHLLFRNAYRIRDDDLFDLSFATKSQFFKDILSELSKYRENHPELSDEEPIFEYLKDKVPGEEVIVRRMIWEIVHKSNFHQYIADDHILLFEANDEAQYGNKFKTHLLSILLEQLNPKKENSYVFDFADHKAKSAGPFEHPRALISKTKVMDSSNYIAEMSKLNADDQDRNRILLSSTVSPPGVRGATALEVLKGVLVLKRILSLNSTMPVTIDEFRVGRQIIFPTEQELKDKYHVIDYDVARFFYEVINYYPEFEQAFNRDSASILLQIRGVK